MQCGASADGGAPQWPASGTNNKTHFYSLAGQKQRMKNTFLVEAEMDVN